MRTLNESFVSDGRTKAMQGMSMVRPVVIPAGQVIYRFYDSTRAATPQSGADGGWWFEFESFQSIKHFAARNGYTLGYAARLFAAVLYEWSEVNAFVACRTVASMSAWKGRGKQVLSSGKDQRDTPTMTPMQSVLEVYQIYLPGIGGARSLLPRALQMQSHGSA